MSDTKVIGQRLILLRAGKSRQQVAKAVNITVSALSNYENGIRVPRDEIKVALAREYGKTVEEIFFA
jgi:transcriptional regulator with XRE-family HTH domain